MGDKYRKGARITGEGRQDLAADLVERYRKGQTIREMAEDIGRSYGFVHGVLVEAGVQMRGRGGPTRGAAGEARRAALRGGG